MKKPDLKTGPRIETRDAAMKQPAERAPVTDLPIDQSLFTPEDTAGYYDGMDAGAYSVPFLALLQALSPQVQRGTPTAIEGANAGMIFNTVTKTVMDKVQVIPLRRSHSLCWWVPRDKGGGFIREEEASTENMAWFAGLPLNDKKQRLIKVDGVEMEVTEHRNFWVCLVNDEKREPALISMAKSQLKIARDWNTNIDINSIKIEIGPNSKPPILHSTVWELGSQLKSKDGNNWYMWSFRFLRKLNNPATDKLLVMDVKEKVQIAKNLTNVQRQLEQIADPTETNGEM